MTVTDMKYFATRDLAPASICAEQVAAADIVVGVLGMRYGSLVPDQPVSYTELEFDLATERGKPRLMFLLDDTATVPLPASALIDRENGDKQDAFRAKVLNSGLVAGSFSTPAQLELLVYQALAGRREAPAAARSRYLTQVRDIAPVGLARGREAELAELAAWCQGDDPYVWWQAPPWAGKSALMSTFVLNPPPNTQVVSFFVTGRLAAQADAVAFSDAVLEQLAVLTGEGVPDALGPGQREIYRRDLLQTAAARAAAEGKRLVLVVDGLDEDAGGHPGVGLPSIASLLPRQVPVGLRVIVAGRPHPELPHDVAGDHPLQDCPRRMLALSPYAVEAAQAARRELDKLLAGDPRHRDLIGLITAAGGGLSSGELQELTRLGRYEIEAMLAGVCGRTIEGRSDTSQPAARRVYLFAHETLRTTAIDRLEGLLDGFRQRIHDWVDVSRAAAWPENTPAYALQGYFSMLAEHGDFARMADAASDHARHSRMLAVTGGDAAALAEIRTVERVLFNAADPDLGIIARLNVHRTVLADKNSHLPVELSAVWARVGNVFRAEALARGLDAPRRSEALRHVAEVVAQTGDTHRAQALLAEADEAARIISSPAGRAKALLMLVESFATVGETTLAETRTADLDPSQRALAIAVRSRAAARSGDLQGFRNLAELVSQDRRWFVLLPVLEGANLLNEQQFMVSRLSHLLAGLKPFQPIDDHSRTIIVRSVVALGGIALIKLFGIGVPGHEPSEKVSSANEPTGQTERTEPALRLLQGVNLVGLEGHILAELVLQLARAGEHERAKALAHELQSSGWVVGTHGWGCLVTAYAVLGDEVGLEDATDRLEYVAVRSDRGHHRDGSPFSGDRSKLVSADPEMVESFVHMDDLHVASKVVASNGNLDRGASIARRIEDAASRARALSSVAEAAATAGQFVKASALASEVEAMARAIVDGKQLSSALALLGRACATVGRPERGLEIAAELTDPEQLLGLSTALATCLHFESAEQVARRIGPPVARVQALCVVADTLNAAGHTAKSHVVAGEAVTVVRAAGIAGHVRADVAAAAARVGLFDRAEPLAHGIGSLKARSRALSALIVALAEAGQQANLDDLFERFPRLADDKAVATMVVKLVGSGHLTQVEAFIAGPRASGYELVGLSALATAAPPSQTARLAAKAEQRLVEALNKPQPIAAIVPALTAERDRDFDRATSLMQHVPAPERERGWFALARTAVKAELPERAEHIARSLTSPAASSLRYLIGIIAERGDVDRVERMTRDLVVSPLRPGVLAEAAVRLAGPSDDGARERHARRLLAEALSLGPWTNCVDAIAAIDPDVVLEIDRQLSRELGE